MKGSFSIEEAGGPCQGDAAWTPTVSMDQGNAGLRRQLQAGSGQYRDSLLPFDASKPWPQQPDKCLDSFPRIRSVAILRTLGPLVIASSAIGAIDSASLSHRLESG